MALSLRNFFMLAAFALPPAAVIACSSSSGGTGASTTTTSMNTGGHTTTTSSTSTSSTTNTTSSSTTTTAGGACLDSADQTALAAHQSTLQADVTGCELANLTDQTKVSPCIQQKDGLSQACADCFSADAACGASKCLSQCAGGASAACTTCLDANCTPAFDACSGISGSPPADAGPG